jgi:hypothetical protein
MRWPIRNDLLLASLAPDIATAFYGAIQFLRLVEPLFIEETGLAAPVRHLRSRHNYIDYYSHSPTALQLNDKLCHFHPDPRFVLLLRGTNIEHQIPRDLYDNKHVSLPVQNQPK